MHYIKEVNKLTNANKFVKFIDTKKYLNSKDKDKNYFVILCIKIIRKIITANISWISSMVNNKQLNYLIIFFIGM